MPFYSGEKLIIYCKKRRPSLCIRSINWRTVCSNLYCRQLYDPPNALFALKVQMLKRGRGDEDFSYLTYASRRPSVKSTTTSTSAPPPTITMYGVSYAQRSNYHLSDISCRIPQPSRWPKTRASRWPSANEGYDSQGPQPSRAGDSWLLKLVDAGDIVSLRSPGPGRVDQRWTGPKTYCLGHLQTFQASNGSINQNLPVCLIGLLLVAALYTNSSIISFCFIFKTTLLLAHTVQGRFPQALQKAIGQGYTLVPVGTVPIDCLMPVGTVPIDYLISRPVYAWYFIASWTALQREKAVWKWAWTLGWQAASFFSPSFFPFLFLPLSFSPSFFSFLVILPFSPFFFSFPFPLSFSPSFPPSVLSFPFPLPFPY